jgi:hypothetical protein
VADWENELTAVNVTLCRWSELQLTPHPHDPNPLNSTPKLSWPPCLCQVHAPPTAYAATNASASTALPCPALAACGGLPLTAESGRDRHARVGVVHAVGEERAQGHRITALQGNGHAGPLARPVALTRASAATLRAGDGCTHRPRAQHGLARASPHPTTALPPPPCSMWCDYFDDALSGWERAVAAGDVASMREQVARQGAWLVNSRVWHINVTALHLACRCRRDAAVAWLLESKAWVHATDNYGRTAAHFAARSNFLSGMQRLTAAGVPVHQLDDQDRSALHIACESASTPVIDALLAAGAVPSHACIWLCVSRDMVEALRLLLARTGHVQSVLHTLADGETLLHMAARIQRIDTTRALLDAGADPTATNVDGLTALQRMRLVPSYTAQGGTVFRRAPASHFTEEGREIAWLLLAAEAWRRRRAAVLACAHDTLSTQFDGSGGGDVSGGDDAVGSKRRRGADAAGSEAAQPPAKRGVGQ